MPGQSDYKFVERDNQHIQLGRIRIGLTTQQTIVKTRIVYTVEDEIPERGL